MQRVLDAVGGALFVLFVPRLLGPADFGKWALATALALWFSLVSGMSSTQTAVRFLPPLAGAGARAELERLVGRLMAMRLATAAVAASAYFGISAFAIPEIDLAVIGIVAGSVFVRSVAKQLFAFLLALGSPARWGLGEALQRWLAVACIVPGVAWGGLTGACWGALASELLVAALGLAWARPFLALRQVRFAPRELAPYLRFGTSFAAGTLLLALSQRSGELLLRVSEVDFASIGVFGVAYRAYLAGNFTLWHLSMSFAPELSAMAAAGDRRGLARWAERLMTTGAVVGTTAVLAALFLGDALLPIVLGVGFAGAAPHFVPLALAMVGMTLAAICRLEAIVLDRWDLSLAGSLLHLAAFWGSGYLLVARLGPLGASLAALVAATLYGGFMALAIRKSAGHRLDRWWRAVALGLPFLALAGLRGGHAVNALLFAVALAGYAVLLVRLGVIRRDELAALRAILFRREVVAPPGEEE